MMGVPVVAISYQRSLDMGYKSKYVKEKIFAPHPEKDEAAFIKLLMDYAKQHGRLLLIPADDATLVTVSRNKVELEKYYITQCTDWEITQRFLDKKFTYALAEEINVPAPKTYVPRSVDQVEKFAETIQFPCLVKPCYSHRYYEHFRRKMIRVDNLIEMKSEFSRANSVGVEVMIQELIIGDDTTGVNYNSVFLNGEPVIEFIAEKVRLSPPSFGIPCVVKSCDDIPEVRESGRKLLKAMDFSGYSCTEFKKDSRDSKYKLMEVNGRHNRSGLLSIKCGINFPWIMYNYHLSGDISSINTYRKGVYWIDEFKDISTTGKRILKGEYSLLKFIDPYIRHHVFAVFDLNDMGPFIVRCINGFKMIIVSLSHLVLKLFVRQQMKAPL